jgi:cytoskeletal protein CcmA (bactofilin family)
MEPMPAAAGKSSFLGSGCVLEGKFNGDGSFECSGNFEGIIDVTGDLVIGHGGTAKAELKARRINIEGRLRGNATGTEKVEVGASGHVEGDVRAPAVQFAEGAFFEGNVEMRQGKPSAAAADEATDSASSEPAQQGGDAPAS